MNYLRWLFTAAVVSKCLALDYVTICGDDGQFGSQLTSYAMVLGYGWTHNKIPVFSKDHLISQPGGQLNYDKVFYRLPQSLPFHRVRSTKHKKQLHHVRSFASIGGIPLGYVEGNVCLCGAVHEITYFTNFKERIRETFSPSQEVIEEITEKYSSLLDHPKTVAVHIRTYHPGSDFHCFLGTKYFETAMDLFDKDHLFVIFSDRIGWCKDHLNLNGRKAIFIEGNNIIIDFYLMSLCKHIIASNSTYSWWAAYLRKDESGLVIVPSRWFYDPYDQDPAVNRAVKKFYPEEWVVLPVDESPEHDWSLLDYETSSIHERW